MRRPATIEAVQQLEGALSLLDMTTHGAIVCHVQLAIDLLTDGGDRGLRSTSVDGEGATGCAAGGKRAER